METIYISQFTLWQLDSSNHCWKGGAWQTDCWTWIQYQSMTKNINLAKQDGPLMALEAPEQSEAACLAWSEPSDGGCPKDQDMSMTRWLIKMMWQWQNSMNEGEDLGDWMWFLLPLHVTLQEFNPLMACGFTSLMRCHWQECNKQNMSLTAMSQTTLVENNPLIAQEESGGSCGFPWKLRRPSVHTRGCERESQGLWRAAMGWLCFVSN